ncbi:MAG: hypothetical protein LBV15_04420 [Planctomycetota bacterium]|jgi:hypothetical protein|nr:hypothetical protein [Planctomycetota bacterium]
MEEAVKKVRLRLEEITPGMRLAEALTDSSGVTLIPGGIRLTPMFISRISKWGLTHLEVRAEDVEAEGAPAKATGPVAQNAGKLPPEMDEFVRAIAEDVSSRFVNVKGNPLMARLRVAAVRGLVAHGKTGWLNLMRQKAKEKDKS